jgi:phosphate/sulfate permease
VGAQCFLSDHLASSPLHKQLVSILVPWYITTPISYQFIMLLILHFKKVNVSNTTSRKEKKKEKKRKEKKRKEKKRKEINKFCSRTHSD